MLTDMNRQVARTLHRDVALAIACTRCGEAYITCTFCGEAYMNLRCALYVDSQLVAQSVARSVDTQHRIQVEAKFNVNAYQFSLVFRPGRPGRAMH